MEEPSELNARGCRDLLNRTGGVVAKSADSALESCVAFLSGRA